MSLNTFPAALTFRTTSGSYITVDMRKMVFVSDYSDIPVCKSPSIQSQILFLAGEHSHRMNNVMKTLPQNNRPPLILCALTYSSGTGTYVTVDIINKMIVSHYPKKELIANDAHLKSSALFYAGMFYTCMLKG